ncbi:MAG: hypothetical protein IJN07_02765 [Clostridia bacterium]|nr:hypothetical protein [Clostridia bacterium]
MVGILLDTNYASSLWCKNLYMSLTARLRDKRIPFVELADTCGGDLDTVFIIASDREWTRSAIQQLNAGNIRPILICNQSEHLPGCIYSCVCSDISNSMKNLLDTLKIKKKSRIALFGMNTDSIADTSRVDSLFVWKESAFETLEVFTNNGSLADCFDRFYARCDRFDAAICLNDFAAVSLVRHLREKAPEKLEKLYILSCAANEISGHYRDHILSLNMNFEQYGKGAVYIYEALKKHRYLSEMTVRVVWSLETEKETPPSSVHLSLPEGKDRFYQDPELNEMMIVDKLLTLSDDTDKKIIEGLLQNDTYEQIADRCFLTVGSVKYHIKKLLQLSGAADKDQMVTLLKTYLS